MHTKVTLYTIGGTLCIPGPHCTQQGLAIHTRVRLYIAEGTLYTTGGHTVHNRGSHCTQQGTHCSHQGHTANISVLGLGTWTCIIRSYAVYSQSSKLTQQSNGASLGSRGSKQGHSIHTVHATTCYIMLPACPFLSMH